MEALEFPIKISEKKVIEIPEKYKSRINPNQEVRVIILLNEDMEEDWNNITLREFFKGYNDKDSAYDFIDN